MTIKDGGEMEQEQLGLKMTLTNAIFKWIGVVIISGILLVFFLLLLWWGGMSESIIEMIIWFGLVFISLLMVIDLIRLKLWAIIILTLGSIFLIYFSIAGYNIMGPIAMSAAGLFFVITIYFWANRKYLS